MHIRLRMLRQMAFHTVLLHAWTLCGLLPTIFLWVLLLRLSGLLVRTNVEL